jgi:hypothetical protein
LDLNGAVDIDNKTQGVNDSADANYNSEIKPLIIQNEQ